MRLLCAFLLAVAGPTWAAELPPELDEMLQKGERFELLSLRPARIEKGKDAFNFHGWEVIGRTWIRDAALRRKLAAALKAGVEESPGFGAACFRPRHGIRVMSQGRVTDVIICFECYNAQVYIDDRPQKTLLLTRSPEAAFNESLKEAKLPLSDQ